MTSRDDTPPVTARDLIQLADDSLHDLLADDDDLWHEQRAAIETARHFISQALAVLK